MNEQGAENSDVGCLWSWAMKEDFSETNRLSACDSQEDRQKLLADLFMRHWERMRRMVQLRLDGRLKGRVDPSDVLQEAYLEVQRRLDEYLRDRPMPLFLWLRRIAGQKLLAFHRHHLGAKVRDARREIRLYRNPMPEATSVALAARLVEEGNSPSKGAIRKEARTRIQNALDTMEAVDREIIALRHFEQLSNGEAASVLDIEESAASKRYLRALKRLKRTLVDMPGWALEEWS